MSDLFWLSDAQWGALEPHLPAGRRGVKPRRNREVISENRAAGRQMEVSKLRCRSPVIGSFPPRAGVAMEARALPDQSPNPFRHLLPIVDIPVLRRHQQVLHADGRIGIDQRP